MVWHFREPENPLSPIDNYRIAVLFWLETEKIRRDRDWALAEVEEDKKRFIIGSANASKLA